MYQEEILQINGVRLWTAVQGEGIPMVLCHGGPGGYDYLGPVADMVLTYVRLSDTTNVEVGVHNPSVLTMYLHLLMIWRD